jgi:hypothetical protein
MKLATLTLAAIEEALVKDQGARFRGFLGELMPLAGDAYSTKEDDFRNHLGASLIGRECAREVWYGFRWATRKRFDGRMLRLFNRGHLEEPRFVALLMMIGCEVWQVDANGKQFRIGGHKGHFGGSMDGVVRGLPDLPNEAVLTEFKTHGDSSFTKLVASGVLSAKWEHFIQMQIYMGKNGLQWALYAAVNKNNDAIHMELVQFDNVQYQRYLDRSVMIIDSLTPPPKINESPGWFKCKFCDHKDVCHGKALPDRNCRTCAHAVPLENGLWECDLPVCVECLKPQKLTSSGWVCDNRHGGADSIHDLITPEKQRVGCDAYEMNRSIKGL